MTARRASAVYPSDGLKITGDSPRARPYKKSKVDIVTPEIIRTVLISIVDGLAVGSRRNAVALESTGISKFDSAEIVSFFVLGDINGNRVISRILIFYSDISLK